MLKFYCLLLSLSLTLPAVSADFSDAQSLRDAMLDKQTARWNAIGARGLILGKRMMDNRTVTFHEAVHDGGRVAYVRHVPPIVMQQRMETAAGIDPMMKAALAQYYPQALSMVMAGLSSEVTGDVDTGMLMGLHQGMGSFMDAAATGAAKAIEEEQQDKQRQLADMDRFFQSAEIVGSEVVHGRETYHLRSTDAGGQIQQDEEAEFEPKSAEVWIDKAELVQVKMKVTGQLTRKGPPQDMVIELDNFNFKSVGPLFEPHRQISRMSGVLSKKEQQELKKAQAEMAKFKAQLDAMPPGQQAMVKQMMGNKLEQFEKMASSGAIEVETIVDRALIGGVVEYGTMMANYAAGIPLDELQAAGLPVPQQP